MGKFSKTFRNFSSIFFYQTLPINYFEYSTKKKFTLSYCGSNRNKANMNNVSVWTEPDECTIEMIKWLTFLKNKRGKKDES